MQPMPSDDPAPPRVFLVDDDARLRDSIRELLMEEGIEVVGEAFDAIGAVQYVPGVARAGRLVVVMDVRMPGRVNGLEATRLLLDRCPSLRVLVLSADGSPGVVTAARQAGALGVLVKGEPAADLLAAIRRVWALEPVGA